MVILGGDEECSVDTAGYCNGRLDSYTVYYVKIRAYNADDQYTDDNYSPPFITGKHTFK